MNILNFSTKIILIMYLANFIENPNLVFIIQLHIEYISIEQIIMIFSFI